MLKIIIYAYNFDETNLIVLRLNVAKGNTHCGISTEIISETARRSDKQGLPKNVLVKIAVLHIAEVNIKRNCLKRNFLGFFLDNFLFL